jgi:propionate catabolism operon transcriptional regulator
MKRPARFLPTIPQKGPSSVGRILFIIPHTGVREMVEQIFGEENDGSWTLDIGHVTGVRPLLHRAIDADVVIARGVTGAALQERLKDIPVVELVVSGYDIMRAVQECRHRFGSRRIGLVAAPSMIYGAKSIEEFVDVELLIAPIANEEEAEEALQRLRAEGVTEIIGGGTSTGIAERCGLNTVFVHSGREAIYQALVEAKRVGTVRRQEQERAEQFRAILDYSAEGIIAVDEVGRVNLANRAAMHLAGISQGIFGSPADRTVPGLGLGRVLESGSPELGTIETLGDQQVAVNCVPVFIRNRLAGAVATFQPVSAIQELEGRIRQKTHRRGHVAKFSFGDVLGESPSWKQTIALSREYSRVDSNVLVVGETGTGKELFAQSLHNASPRAKGPFVAVNCAALPENLLESELFGYVEGAFTGAVRGGKVGLFEQAHRGTLLLDEVSEISPALQGKLLRALQEREIMRLGGDRVIPVDVRVIASTNRDLLALVQGGRFRADLYYRLDILKIVLPPLRERKEDLLLLLRHFLKEYATRFHKPLRHIAGEAQALLLAHDWPGNVRELRNLAERLTVLPGGDASPIGESQVRTVFPQGSGPEGRRDLRKETARAKAGGEPAGGGLDRKVIEKVLEESDYHYGKTAARLGISRTTLWRRLRQTE